MGEQSRVGGYRAGWGTVGSGSRAGWHSIVGQSRVLRAEQNGGAQSRVGGRGGLEAADVER